MKAYLSKFSYLLLKALAAPATPAAGLAVQYINASKQLCYKDDAGLEHVVGDVAQIQTDVLKSAVAGGAADALTATLTPAPTLTDMMRIYVRAAAANATTTPTLNVNGNGAIPITKQGGVALLAGDIIGAGHELQLAYRASVPRWELLNPAPPAGGGGGGGSGNEAVTQDFTGTSATPAGIPIDNTKPQNTEGAAYAALDTTITPISGSSTLEVEVMLSTISCNASNTLVFALFRDSAPDAIATMIIAPPTAGYSVPIPLRVYVPSGAASATTFKLRFSGGGATVTIGSSNNMGGTIANTMRVREI